MFIRLKDQTEIELNNLVFSFENITCKVDSQGEGINLLHLLTNENVEALELYNEDKVFITKYEPLCLINEPAFSYEKDEEDNYTGKILVSFNVRFLTEVEILRRQLEALQESQDTQDLAIDDLAGVVSELAEG